MVVKLPVNFAVEYGSELQYHFAEAVGRRIALSGRRSGIRENTIATITEFARIPPLCDRCDRPKQWGETFFRTFVGPAVAMLKEMSELMNQLTLKRILCPTDFSPNSKQALEYACGLSDQFQADLHVLHVVQVDILRAMADPYVVSDSRSCLCGHESERCSRYRRARLGRHHRVLGHQ